MKTTDAQLKATIKSFRILTNLIAKAITSIFLLCFAKWVQRFGRFMDKSDPGPLFVICIGCIIGFLTGFLNYDMRHLELNVPFYKCLWVALVVCIKFGFTGLFLLYFLWEMLQGCKWMYKWSEKYQRDNRYEKAKEQVSY